MILYVPTVFGTYGRAVGDLAAYPEVSYLEIQQCILRIFTEFPDLRLIYKDLIVANDPNRVMPEFIRRHVPNASVSYQRLTDLMWSVDAIILDHALTALSEVVLTRKPLIVYLPQPNSSSREARAALRKRATVAETPGDFAQAVRAFLTSRDFSELVEPDQDFLRLYCTHKDDGRSAERAAEVVLQDYYELDTRATERAGFQC